MSVCFYFASSSVNMNSVPTPTVLTTSMFSPCAWITSLVIERPSPEPFLSRPLEESDF